MKLPARLSRLSTSQKAEDRDQQKHMSAVDARPEALVQRKENDMIAGSPRTLEQQQHFAGSLGDKKTDRERNNTGLPDTLKAGLENLSGLDLSDVKVHYNSSRPAQHQALAYAQGNEIHLAPGQQQYLPHEGWHVVQQRQRKVKPTLQLRNGQHMNNQAHLEQEADAMGAKAVAAGKMSSPGGAAKAQPASTPLCHVAQMKFIVPKADQKSTEVRELNAEEVKEIRAKLAGNAAALKVFETEMTLKSYHIIEHQGSAAANVDFIINFCREEAGRQQKTTPSEAVSAAPAESKKISAGKTSVRKKLTGSSASLLGSEGGKAWKQGLDRKKQKGADGAGVEPALNDEKRKRGHRAGKRHAKADAIMENTVGATSEESTAHFGHLIGRRLGGGFEAANKAVTTTRQEAWQKVVEKAVAKALRDGMLKAAHVKLKVTAYTIPDSRDTAKALRIKVLLFDGAAGGFVKMIDVTTTHACEVDPDESVQKRIGKVLDDWGKGKGNVYDWVRIHDGYNVRD